MSGLHFDGGLGRKQLLLQFHGVPPKDSVWVDLSLRGHSDIRNAEVTLRPSIMISVMVSPLATSIRS